jgi:hypothetical protein
MHSKNHRLFVAAALFALSLVAVFGGCGLSTHGTATNNEARCTAASQCNDGEVCTQDDCTGDGVCTHTALPDGDGPASTQKPGSCTKTVCKSGVLSVVNDDQNVSDDGEFCTDDECKDGKPVHPAKAEGTECKEGQAVGKCTSGKCAVECGVGLPPCDDKNACTNDSCDVANGKCVFTPLDGIKIPGVVDKPGDCKTPRCVGGKAVDEAHDDTDLPAAKSDCETPTCTAGVPSTPPVATGTACSTQGGRVCDGAGACVACNTPSDCVDEPENNECRTRTCDPAKHTCGMDFVPKDSPLVAQTPGDCQVLVCDGAGNKISKNDDADPPQAVDCHQHACTNGVPQTGPLAKDTKCGVNDAFVCDDAGHCVGCNAPTDCNGSDNDCQTRTCKNNTCGFDYQPDGKPLPDAKQKLGDCQQLQCNGAGLVKSAAFDTDVPVDSNDCTADVCSSGIPANPPLQLDTVCAKGFCDGAASCVQCNHAAQCPNPPSCVTATCNNNTCGTSNVAAGTLAPPAQQTPGDCKDAICDGNGKVTTQADTNDLPNDNNQCTSDTCTAQGVPSYAPKPAHTACSQNNGKVCDGNTTCVGCVDNTDCTNPSTCGGGNPGTANVCGCTKKTCAQQNATCGTPVDGCGAGGTLACNDGQKNGTETDVDCGGVAAGNSTCTVKCGQGKACLVNSDCSSGFCADGVCCNAACTGTACMACTKALNGVADGQCLQAKTGIADPRSMCAAGDVCAANGKCQCADGSKDGAESDIDCGGGVCPKCGGAKTCGVGTDCSSGFCSDGFCCDKACSTACVACSKALNGNANGTCGNIAAGANPDPAHTACAQNGDVCGNGGNCRCNDGTKDGNETDIDCGGGTCAKCVPGKVCKAGTDCASGFCVDGVCCDSACSGTCQACTKALTVNSNDGTCASIPAGNAHDLNKAACAIAADVCGTGGLCRCADGVKDGTETDVDCGGSTCAKCGGGKACKVGTDCGTGFCADGVCCDTACGGTCQACTAALTGGTDGTCSSVKVNTDPHNSCSGGAGAEACAAGGKCQCADNVMDGSGAGTETDVDCGGSYCAGCAGGKKCALNSDCASAFCNVNTLTCVASGCSDGVKDGQETDVDCGGATCSKCAVGLSCLTSSDCATTFCNVSTLKCVASQCADGAKDGAETDVDCGGGTCTKCGLNQGCTADSDCTSNACDAQTNKCVADQCADHRKDGVETDVDCGGGTCGTCATEKACLVDADCTSGGCTTGTKVCAASQCSDAHKDGQETDVDCGGPTCSKCATGLTCAADTDCASGACDLVTTKCVASACVDERKDGAETDVDCGGGTCPMCATGKTCAANTDCTSAACDLVTTKCVSSTCVDERQDGTETDVDCGGACATKCANGAGCLVNADCASNNCNGASKCSP